MNDQQLSLPLMTPDDVLDRKYEAGASRHNLGIMTEEELAIALGLKSTTTLAAWRAEKSGPPPAKLGKSVFYRVDDVKAWIAERACAA